MINFKQYYRLITEGGQYGHMFNPYEDHTLSFANLKDMIEQMFSGSITEVKEKTDGQALSVSFRKDMGVIFSRNKTHTIAGVTGDKANALRGAKQVEEKFGEAPDHVKSTFRTGADALQKAIMALTPAQRRKLFGEGTKWVAVEIIHGNNPNVIPYLEVDGKGKRSLIVLHSYREYDAAGGVIDSDFDEYGRMMAGMIKQKGKSHIGDYTIMSMPMVKLHEGEQEDGESITNFKNMVMDFDAEVNVIRDQFSLTDEHTIGDYWLSFMTESARAAFESAEYHVEPDFHKRLALRLVAKKLPKFKSHPEFQHAITHVRDIEFQLGKSEQTKNIRVWLNNFEGGLGHTQAYNAMINPLKLLTLKVGTQFLSNMSEYLTLNPSDSIKDIKANIDRTVADIRSGGDESSIAKLDAQIDIINKLGGLEKIIPTEGVTFTYTKPGLDASGHPHEQVVYKLTGIFAPINQILGSLKFSR